MRNHTWLACCMYVVGLSGYKQKVFDMMSRAVAGRCMGDRCTINSVNKTIACYWFRVRIGRSLQCEVLGKQYLKSPLPAQTKCLPTPLNHKYATGHVTPRL